MTRRYAPLWARLVSNETVILTCHISKVVTIKRALYKEKSRSKLVRDVTELPSYGRMTISEEVVVDKKDTVRLIVNLAYSGSNL